MEGSYDSLHHDIPHHDIPHCGAGIGGADFLDMDDLMERLGTETANSLIRWRNGQPIKQPNTGERFQRAMSQAQGPLARPARKPGRGAAHLPANTGSPERVTRVRRISGIVAKYRLSARLPTSRAGGNGSSLFPSIIPMIDGIFFKRFSERALGHRRCPTASACRPAPIQALAARPKASENSYSTNDYWTEFIETTGIIVVDYRTNGSPTVSIRARAFADPAST